MARVPYIFTPEEPIKGSIRISGNETRHLTKVLRAKAGFRFIAFNGLGQGWQCEIASTGKDTIRADVIEEISQEPASAISLTLAVAVIKGSRMDWAVEKAAESGARHFIPLITEFGVIEPGSHRVERWRSIALSAAKQSRSMRIMEVHPPVKLDVLFGNPSHGAVIVLDPDPAGKPLIHLVSGLKTPTDLMLVIGPEGGFSSDEIEMFERKKIQMASLSSCLLRTETASVVAAGLVNIISGLIRGQQSAK